MKSHKHKAEKMKRTLRDYLSQYYTNGRSRGKYSRPKLTLEEIENLIRSVSWVDRKLSKHHQRIRHRWIHKFHRHLQCPVLFISSQANKGDMLSISGSGWSPGEGNGNPLQYSGHENFMGREVWWATIRWVTKSWIWLSTHSQAWWIFSN